MIDVEKAEIEFEKLRDIAGVDINTTNLNDLINDYRRLQAKEKPMKVDLSNYEELPNRVCYDCPSCVRYIERFQKYCPECRQALDWSSK